MFDLAKADSETLLFENCGGRISKQKRIASYALEAKTPPK
jgi:hypothetical protein